MQTAQSSGTKAFAPHPGKIVFLTVWNHSTEIKMADDVPDTNKFVYYDAQRKETTDTRTATSRTPIVEVEMTSVDRDGRPVEPSKAARISISEFGPGHKELRHSTGPGPRQ